MKAIRLSPDDARQTAIRASSAFFHLCACTDALAALVKV
jgi:hypothetical protein